MSSKDFNIYDLIIKKLSGEANSAEIGELDIWINESDSNKSYYEEVCDIWSNSGKGNFDKEYNVDDAWNNINSILDDKVVDISSNKKSRSVLYYLNRVAAIFIIGLISWFFYQTEDKPELITLVNNELGSPDTLPDGSVVYLNSNATIKYYNKFSDGLREVHLDGEAYFKVENNSNKPFIINTEKVYLKVLGTEFNVNVINSKDVKVTVDEGKVGIYRNDVDKHNNKCENVVTENKIGIYASNEDLITISENNDNNYISWMTGELEFKGEKLKDVFTRFEKFYNIKIDVLDDEIHNLTLIGKYDRNQSHKDVMEIIKYTFYDIEISSPDENKYVVKMK